MQNNYWDYKTVSFKNLDLNQIDLELYHLGQSGWELVNVFDFVGVSDSPFAILKRPTEYYGEPCDPDALVS